MISTVDQYLTQGCGRCPLGNSPACKVNFWREALQLLREIVLDVGLTETVKWSVPCYTWEGSNVVIVSAFKDYCSVNFFEGALLQDPHQILRKPGENTQAGRIIPFTSVEEVKKLEPILRAYLQEAIENEIAGLKVVLKKELAPLPEELLQQFEIDSTLKNAFYQLTPGRQRGYLLHFTEPKQSKTRLARIMRCRDKILSGKGFQDR